MTAMLKLSRRLVSTTSGLMMFGSTSAKRILRARLAHRVELRATKSRSHDLDGRAARAPWRAGQVVIPTASTRIHSSGPTVATATSAEHDRREREDHVHRPHQHIVEDAARGGGDEADGHSHHDAEERGERREREDRAPAPEERG